MSDTTRKRLATGILTLSLLGSTTLAATTATFESAWTDGNSQPASGLFLAEKERFAGLAVTNETHTGGLTTLPR
jgi:hypothetical protein